MDTNTPNPTEKELLAGCGKIPVFNQIRNWFYAEVRTSGSGIE